MSWPEHWRGEGGREGEPFDSLPVEVGKRLALMIYSRINILHNIKKYAYYVL
jgi:hypothetical protein